MQKKLLIALLMGSALTAAAQGTSSPTSDGTDNPAVPPIKKNRPASIMECGTEPLVHLVNLIPWSKLLAPAVRAAGPSYCAAETMGCCV